MVEVLEEKKLTNEEIVKALYCLKGQYISYIDDDDDKCKLLFVDDILNLIHRLQEHNGNEVRMRCDMQRKFDDLQDLCIEQKAEIERLTEENKNLSIKVWNYEKPVRTPLYSNESMVNCNLVTCYNENAELKAKNAKLQKQVYELKEQFLSTCENCHLKKDIELLRYQKEQAVKDTAIKCMTDIEDCINGMLDGERYMTKNEVEYLLEHILNKKQEYGVEVE
jgi:hypothetical protein